MLAEKLKSSSQVVMKTQVTAKRTFLYSSSEMTSSVSQEAYPIHIGKTLLVKFASFKICLTLFMAGICSLGPDMRWCENWIIDI